MTDRVTRIALDVDGTLSGYGGIIDKWTIGEFLKSAHVGIVSTRGDCHNVASEFGLGYACCAGVDKPTKADCLRDYAQKYPVNGGSLYIADTPHDFTQALNAGWNFADVNHLRLNLGAGNDVHTGVVKILSQIKERKKVDTTMLLQLVEAYYSKRRKSLIRVMMQELIKLNIELMSKA